MGLFDVLKDVAGKAVGDALAQGVKKVVTNTATHAANEAADVAGNAINAQVDKVADKYRDGAASASEGAQAASGSFAEAIDALKNIDTRQVADAFSALGGLAQGIANSVKVCPNCGTPVPADGEFCPNCGTKAVTLAQAEGLEGKDLGQEIKSGLSSGFAPSGSGRYSEATVGSFGESMPDEPNMYNYQGSPEAYLTDIFSSEFADYQLVSETGYGGRTRVFTLLKGGQTALVTELLPDNSGSIKLREKCRKEGTPYLRFYYGHDGWWNTRRYVVERVRSSLRI